MTFPFLTSPSLLPQINAAMVGDVRTGEFLHLVHLMLPLYCPRAAEILFFGPDGVSLVTAAGISDCFQIAYHCVKKSVLHPRFRSMLPFRTNFTLGDDHWG